MRFIKKAKRYIFSLRYYILFSSVVFLGSILIGYFNAPNDQGLTDETLETLSEMIKPILDMSPAGQFLVVFLKNAFAGLLAILLGAAFGIFPIIILFLNGSLLGILASALKETLSFSDFLLGILPHGILEIPFLIIAASCGMKVGRSLTKGDFKKEFTSALVFFLKILLPIVFLAALIEIFITPKFLS